MDKVNKVINLDKENYVNKRHLDTALKIGKVIKIAESMDTAKEEGYSMPGIQSAVTTIIEHTGDYKTHTPEMYVSIAAAAERSYNAILPEIIKAKSEAARLLEFGSLALAAIEIYENQDYNKEELETMEQIFEQTGFGEK